MGDTTNFSKLMQAASENRLNNAGKSTRCLKTTFKPPKKISRQDVALSQKVKEFLAKKNEEERMEQERKDEEKRNLLEKRSEDSKAVKRVQLMRKSAKSASKSVMSDANDDALAQMRQPDEDDYGFSSKTESEMYDKMVKGYVAQNDDKKFSTSKKPAMNLSATKDRVRQAFEKEQLEAQLPHRRKRKPKPEEDTNNYYSDHDHDEPLPKAPTRPKVDAPPPMNFMQVLQAAQQNKDKPMLDEEIYKPIPAKNPAVDEPERLMTKRQRAEYLKEKEFLEKKAAREKMRQTGELPAPVPGPSGVAFGAMSRIPKIPKIKREDSTEASSKDQSPVKSSRPIDKQVQRPSDSSKVVIKSERPSESHKTIKTERPSESYKTIKTERPSESQKVIIKSERPSSSSTASKSQSKIPEKSAQVSKKPSLPTKSLPTSRPVPTKSLPDPKKRLQAEETRSSEHRKDSASRPSAFEKPRPAQGRIPAPSKSPSPMNRTPSKPPPSLSSADRNRPPSQLKGKPTIRPAGTPIRAAGTPTKSSGTPIRPAGTPIRPAAAPSRPNGQQASAGRPGAPAAKPALGPSKTPGVPPRPQPVPGRGNPGQRRPDERPAARPGGPPGRLDNRPGGSRPPPGRMDGRPPMKRPMGNGYPPGRRRPMKKKMTIDSDSEYDSEMDDFIDDSPMEGEPDISSVLRDVFGYDKRKYSHMDYDDDDQCMESSYGQINKEEYKSTKAGLMEDLADIQKKKAMKAAAKKRKEQL